MGPMKFCAGSLSTAQKTAWRNWLGLKLSISTRERKETGYSVLDFSVTGYSRR